ncbi:hypothetical protein LXA43DRAFT_907796 [Ganoderma leucocontextum]|nr:hypothetical protein LXA43DRAFT_907796 [Ganoderma leucocontextum]
MGSDVQLTVRSVPSLQRFCQTNSASETSEMCAGLKKRHKMLGHADPEVVVSDNCCKVEKAIKAQFLNTHVGLDIWHVLRRYMGCVLGGSKNGSRSAIGDEIASAILKTRADKYNPAVYWPREEQERRLDEVYRKWEEEGAWTTAGASTHSEQMKHIRKGCLTRPRNDIRADGSRIEGNHRAWNSLQRSWPSGLDMLTTLSHDFILRRNLRIGRNLLTPTAFTVATYGSHHVRLVKETALRWNSMIHTAGSAHLFSGLADLPLLKTVASGETFGIVESQFARNYQYLVTDIKQDDDDDDLIELSKPLDECTHHILSSLNVGPIPQVLNTSDPVVPNRLSVDSTTSSQPEDSDACATTSSTTVQSAPTNACAPLALTNTAFSTSYQPLKLPPIFVMGQTRSQRIFSIKTGINPLSTKIDGDDEHALFMKLRLDHQWVSHAMSPRKYVEAASVYNTELEKANRLNAYISYTVRKTPRAIMEKLGSVEDMIVKRLVSQEFVCESY